MVLRRGPALQYSHGVTHSLLDILGGLYQLLRLGVISRFRFRGPYWQWRLHTAFGRGYPSSRWELVKSVISYGIWMHRMRRFR
jgi:hypothetical protein